MDQKTKSLVPFTFTKSKTFILTLGNIIWGFNTNHFIDIPLEGIVQINSGLNSIIAMTKQGQVYEKGQNLCGELGIYLDKNVKHWTLCKTKISDIQIGFEQTFLFIFQPFLFYNPKMNCADVVIS